MKLRGINALVTGGSQGFGRHIVEAFLAEGANVMFCARTARDIDKTRGELEPRLHPDQRLLACPCDIGEPSSVDALFSELAALGPLHVVVNNAGIYGPMGPTEEIPLEEWDQAWRVNVTGTLLVCQRAVRLMKANGGGNIINISGGGATNPMPRLAAYAATKAAVVRLTETLAEEYRGCAIAVNAIAPGALRTRMMKQVLAAGPEKVGADFFARNKKWVEEGAVDPRLGAALCVYLASAESRGITGKLISAQWDPWKDLHRFQEDLRGDIYTLRRIVPEDRSKKFT